MIGSEKLCEGNLSTSLLEGCSGSDAAQSIAKTVQLIDLKTVGKRHAGTWLSRLPWTKMKKIEQVRGLSVPNPYHCATDASSLDGDIWSTLHPPA